jgi:murein tripeptide amidase MpaA
MNTKNIIVIVLLLIIIAVVAWMFTRSTDVVTTQVDTPDTTEVSPTEPETNTEDEESEELAEPEERGDETVLGSSVEGNNITAYHYGGGEEELLLIAGIHGGYSWNTPLLAYELMDYLEANPNIIPENLTVTVIPVANPDGLEATVGTTGEFSSAEALTVSETVRIAGRFNANEVDLNRNFNCDWSATSNWRDREVSGGSAPFSEPEAAAIRDYVNSQNIVSSIVWFSAEGRVYPSSCEGDPSTASTNLANTFADAADYEVEQEFDGDMVNWMASQNIPAISVLLTNHQDIELAKNQTGLRAVLTSLAN